MFIDTPEIENHWNTRWSNYKPSEERLGNGKQGFERFWWTPGNVQGHGHAQERPREGPTFSLLVDFQALCKQELKANAEMQTAWLNVQCVLLSLPPSVTHTKHLCQDAKIGRFSGSRYLSKTSVQ